MRMNDLEHYNDGSGRGPVGSPNGAECLTPSYEPPRLVVLGDLRSLTLGGPSGVGDSPAPTTQTYA
jgi:hypothetical protein